MSLLVCGVDLETTGLDLNKDIIIEAAAVIWDVERKIPVMTMCDMVKIPGGLPPEISEITGITADDLNDYGKPWETVAQTLVDMMKSCNYVMAHNGLDFDKPMLSRCLTNIEKEMPDRVWIDTMLDIPYPKTMKSKKLAHLAAEHFFINPFAHRALFDVLTMLKVASMYDMHELIASAKSPLVKVQALCAKPWEDGGVSTDEAKQLGYKWDGNLKQWCKRIRQRQLEKEEVKPQHFRQVIVNG